MAKNIDTHDKDKQDVLERIEDGKKQPLPEGFEIFGGCDLFGDDFFYDKYVEETEGNAVFQTYEATTKAISDKKLVPLKKDDNKSNHEKATAKRLDKKKTKRTTSTTRKKTNADQITLSATNVLDIDEDHILDVLPILLADRTTGKNIIWAVDAYSHHGDDYTFNDEIKIEQITGDNHDMIKPRIAKSALAQSNRTKEHAEVFTPSWICNLQNNQVDESWFGFCGAFNTAIDDDANGTHTWESSDILPFDKIKDKQKTWKKYIADNRMEITCGEAPYLTSRYDTTTGNPIKLHDRIGLLDRKLRVIKERVPLYKQEKTVETEEYGEEALFKYAEQAYKSTFGFEWQGDNLLLARENLYASFIDFWRDITGDVPSIEKRERIAYIISNNIIQMDGIELTIPGSNTPATLLDWEDNEKRIMFSSLIRENGEKQNKMPRKKQKKTKTTRK